VPLPCAKSCFPLAEALYAECSTATPLPFIAGYGVAVGACEEYGMDERLLSMHGLPHAGCRREDPAYALILRLNNERRFTTA
jgi:hypothetical protein